MMRLVENQTENEIEAGHIPPHAGEIMKNPWNPNAQGSGAHYTKHNCTLQTSRGKPPV